MTQNVVPMVAPDPNAGDQKISELPPRSTLAKTDEFPVIAGGVNYKAKVSALTPLLTPGPPGPPGPAGPPGVDGLYDAKFSGASSGASDNKAALVSADAAANAQESYLYINGSYKVGSNLTLSARVRFGPKGKLRPASGTTITLAGGFSAPPTQWVFDTTLGGECWSTLQGPITAHNYGAKADNATNDRIAIQHLIDSCLYFQHQAIRLEAGNFFVSGGPLMVSYGDGFRGTNLYGDGLNSIGNDNFPGTHIRTDWWGNLIEVQGARSMEIDGIGFEGPFYTFISGTYYGTVPEGGQDAGYVGDPRNHENWVPPAARAAGVLGRFKMNSAIHVDPRCTDPHNTIGLKPTPVWKTDVRLVVRSELNATAYENGDVVQGVALATGDRILQAVAIDLDGWPGLPSNGVYVVQATGKPLRASDMDATGEFINAAMNCTAGTYAGTKWVCNTQYITALDATGGYAYGYGYGISFMQFDGELCYPDYDYPSWAGITGQYGKALSSNVTVRNCDFKGFGTAFAVKGCNADGNADFMRMEYCGAQYNVYVFAWGHTQARAQGVISCNFSNSRSNISSVTIGRQSGESHFKALNSCLDGAIDILDLPNLGLAGTASLDLCYVEAGYRFGRASSTNLSGGLEIVGGVYSWGQHVWMRRVPRFVLDCRSAGVVMSPQVTINLMTCPFIIWGDPRQCTVHAQITLGMWYTTPPGQNPGTPDATISKADAIMKHSTMEVLFLNTRQGPWTGRGVNPCYNITTASNTATFGNKWYGPHVVSNVTNPIPFCATTIGTSHWTGTDSTADPYVVALGDRATEAPHAHPAYFSAPSTLVGRTLTMYLNPAQVPSLAVAMNGGFTPGCIIFAAESNMLFVIQTLVGSTLTAKLLNLYNYIGAVTPDQQVRADDTIYFIPTGHYVPDSGPELTFTGGSNTVTYKDNEGDTSMGAQFPVGAVKMVHNSLDVGTPILRASAAITASATPGSFTLSGPARAAPEGTARQRPGIWFVPR